MKAKVIRGIAAFIILIVLLVLIIKIINISLFDPINNNRLTRVDISQYRSGSYTDLAVTDSESLSTLSDMKKGVTRKASVIKGKIRDSEAFQKDSSLIFEFLYDNNIHQRIEITGNNIILFNYCKSGDSPKYCLDYTPTNYEASLGIDGLYDYGLWLFYEAEENGEKS